MTATAPAQEGKTCTKCGVWKGFGEFHNNKANRGGKSGKCKPCAVLATRAWYAANKDRAAQGTAQYRARPDIAQAIAAHRRRRYAESPEVREKRLAQARRWQQANPDKRAEVCAASQRDRDIRPISDRYARKLIAQGTDLAHDDIPPELVEFKREQLQLHRLLRDFQQVLSDEGETA